jgi:hypothetical protein
MGSHEKPNEQVQSGAIVRGGVTRRLAVSAFSTLAVWVLPVIIAAITALALAGQWRQSMLAGFRGDSDQNDVVSQGREPVSVGILYYSVEYIDVIKAAVKRDGRDVLASGDVFDSSWNSVSPRCPFVIALVHSPLSETDPVTGLKIPRISGTTVLRDSSQFVQILPLLKEIRTLILAGDGSGRGVLPKSGFYAEPSPMSQEVQDGSLAAQKPVPSGGPRKRMPEPVATF